MDGTLLNDQKEISPANTATIQEAVDAGVKLVLCTGRILSGVKPYFEQLGLDAENEYVILNNGCALHQTSDWSLLDHHGLKADEIAYLADFARGFELPLTLCDVDNYYVVDQTANAHIIEDTQNIFLTPKTIWQIMDILQANPLHFWKQNILGKFDLILRAGCRSGCLIRTGIFFDIDQKTVQECRVFHAFSLFL